MSQVAVENGVPRPPSTAKQIAIRLPQEVLDEADRLARVLVRPGFTMTRSDVLRAAAIEGLKVLAAQATPPASPIAGSVRQQRQTIPGDRPSKPKTRK